VGFPGTPTYLTDVSTTVNGTVGATYGALVTFWVEYGTTKSYGHVSPQANRIAGAHSQIGISVPIAGLAPNTTYHYRICAQDSQQGVGPGCGADATFTTDSPGGRSGIAFLSDRGAGSQFTRNDIVVMAGDGSVQTNVTNSPSVEESEPAWSPDGRKLAFACLPFQADGVTAIGTTQVCVANADGGNRVTLAAGHDPAWSPDGRRIAFTRSTGGDEDIWLMDPVGTHLVNLTKHAGPDTKAAWSPDGKRIAFVSVPDSSDPGEIYVMNRDGSGRRQLTDDDRFDSDPAWNPKIRPLAFTHSLAGSRAFEIFGVDADGPGELDLTDRDGTEADPSWSPDGTELAFTDANGEIFSFDQPTRTFRNLTKNSAGDYQPAWSPRP
jgi:TolB protein